MKPYGHSLKKTKIHQINNKLPVNKFYGTIFASPIGPHDSYTKLLPAEYTGTRLLFYSVH